jgi:hypothetical protein
MNNIKILIHPEPVFRFKIKQDAFAGIMEVKSLGKRTKISGKRKHKYRENEKKVSLDNGSKKSG